MHPEALTYLTTERVGVLAVAMPDGSVHGATVHYAYSESGSVFYFQTFNNSKKAAAFINGETCKATFVIGTDESSMKTMQLDGEVKLLASENKDQCEATYLGKFPEKTERSKDPKAVYFTFTPTWWRYSDYKRAEGKLIVSSEQ